MNAGESGVVKATLTQLLVVHVASPRANPSVRVARTCTGWRTTLSLCAATSGAGRGAPALHVARFPDFNC